jgi:hypothetical protein
VPDQPSPVTPPPPGWPSIVVAGRVLCCTGTAGDSPQASGGRLRQLLDAHPDVRFASWGVDPDDAEGWLLDARAAERLVGDVGGMATLLPVVDALKRVDEDRVAETVDRSSLRRAVAPAVVRADVLRAALGTERSTAVAPLTLVGRTHRILPLRP